MTQGPSLSPLARLELSEKMEKWEEREKALRDRQRRRFLDGKCE